MSAECFSAIHLCRIRATRLDATGNPSPGPNNAYVTAKPMMLGVTPQIEAGQDKTLVGGCDCIVAQYRGYDKLKYFTLEVDFASIEPALIELMVGATAITKAGDVIGNWWPAAQTFNCTSAVQPNVCIEGWQDTWQDDHQASAPFRYVHWIWPSSYWQIAAHTLQNDFLQPKLTGFTRGNTNWTDIYRDLPEVPQALGGYFFTNTIPDAQCGYITHSIT